MRLTQLLSSLVLTAASSGLFSAANAQTTVPNPAVEYTGPRTLELDASFSTPPRRLETIPEAFNRAFFRESGDFYRNRKIDRQINYIIGAGVPWGAGFPDLELERDAERVFKLYQELLELQASTGPVIRTPDLANPFDTSVRLLSGPPRFGNRLEGGEFIFDTVPPR
ncbi:hypothetical protein [Allocoleopsis franciscana]|uniref:Uncharacterized protein n=1 Tax=Allocoleopsis franciscana PCC 7113 TaxID=1173027 RepID=K9W9G9_9CYAN|nr:hypothetical protein [Allocoleopsis franciscana]AFZ16122.1 hypothetical protein Mic7113_0186 [Allocoleopsis franciscana PCC 7113]